MEIIGQTSNKLLVVNGAYHLYSTFGIPLEYICLVLSQNRYIIDWLGLISDAIGVGMKQSNIISKVKVVTLDVYGKEFSDAVMKRINLLLKQDL